MFKCQKSPSDDLTMTNKVFFNPSDWKPSNKYVDILCNSKSFTFMVDVDSSVTKGFVSMGGVQRLWVYCGIGELLECRVKDMVPTKNFIVSCTIDLDFFAKNTTHKDPVDTDKLAMVWMERFLEAPLTLTQPILFNALSINFKAVVKNMHIMDTETSKELTDSKIGVFCTNSVVKFARKSDSRLVLGGRCQDETNTVNIINPNWDFNSIGVGGIDRQFTEIFRRAFVSRLLPMDIVEKLGLPHVRGMLLYGPPGTGKTLMARQIGKMLNAREPKIVNGPSILDKFVGESEANIRRLFADAEEEFKRMGNNSALHIIIFDEIDAICKARGSFGGGGSAVQDTVVNQLLSKMDGVEQLNNVLVIGMTNRRDLIDEALLRPGRMEVQIEIALPDEHGRLQILEIHTGKLSRQNVLGADVVLPELAALTKNFSGAEIEGLVKAAFSNSLYDKFDPKKGIALKREDIESIKVMRHHFMYSLENDIKPFFGSRDSELEEFGKKRVLVWGPPIEELLDKAGVVLRSIRENSLTTKATLLLLGAPRCGLTTLAVQLANNTEFSFVRLVSLRAMVGFTESARLMAIKKIFDDALRAPSAVIILDDIEALIDYSSIGPRFSVTMVNSIVALINGMVPPEKKILVIGTSKEPAAMRELKIQSSFDESLRVPLLNKAKEVGYVMSELDMFSNDEVERATTLLGGSGRSLKMGIKEIVTQCEILRLVEPRRRIDILVEKMGPRELTLDVEGNDIFGQF